MLVRLKIFLVLLLLMQAGKSSAQSTAGLTRVNDTSYNTPAEYRKLVKQYSFINIPGQSSHNIKSNKDIVYCTSNSRNLKLDVFFPASKTKSLKPCILIIHGGGWRSGNRMQHHTFAQRLAALGYVCLTPEYRLSTEALYPAAVHDLKSAIRWIRANALDYQVDTNRIAIAGFSAGGHLAALLGTTTSQPFFEGDGCYRDHNSSVQAIIDIDGTLSFVHPESGEGDDSKKTSAATYWFGYTKKENPVLWKQASPLTHVGPYTPPVLFLNSSVERMHAGRDDFNRMLDKHGIYHQEKTFAGAPHSFILFQPWFDSSLQIIDAFLDKVFKSKTFKARVTVAKDGSGDYQSIQQALHAIPRNNQKQVTIFIKKGVYKEKLFLDSTKSNLILAGEDPFNTILSYDDHSGKIAANGDTLHTFNSYSFLLEANNVKAINLSIENTAGNTAGQAVAMHIMGDRISFFNCLFLGHQDVLYAGKAGSRQYFESCYIEGTTDFIFGPSIAWFEKCHINSKRNSHVTAASTPKEQAYGYVFNNCVLTTDSAHVNKVTLGRPWRPYANVTYINCYLGAHIIPEGWNNWRNVDNEKTARYAEFNSYGPGARPTSRLAWTKQLTELEASKYTLRNVMGNWNPLKDK